MKHFKTRPILIFCLIVLTWSAFCQDTTYKKKTKPRHLFWASVGLFPAQDIGFAAGVSANYAYNKNLFTARIITLLPGNDEYSYSDRSLLYGHVFKTQAHILASVSAGLGLIRIFKFSFLNKYPATTILNIPLEAQIIFIPFKFIGIGLKGFANINEFGSSGLGLITLQFGKLK